MSSALRRGRALDWLLFGLAGAAVVWAHQFGVASVAVLHATAGAAVVRRHRAAKQADAAGRVPAGAVGWAVALGLTAAAVVALVAGRAMSGLTIRRANVGPLVAGVLAVLALATLDQSARVAARHTPPPATAASVPASAPTSGR